MAILNTTTLKFVYGPGPVFQAIRDSFSLQQLGNGQPGFVMSYTATTYETQKAFRIRQEWTSGADTIQQDEVWVFLTLTSTRVAPVRWMQAEPGIEGATVINWADFAAAGKVLATVRSDWGSVITVALLALWNQLAGEVAVQNTRLDYDVCNARLRYSARERSIQGPPDWYSQWEHLIIINNNNPSGQTQASVTWNRLAPVASAQPAVDTRSIVLMLEQMLYRTQSISINNGQAIYSVEAQVKVG